MLVLCTKLISMKAGVPTTTADVDSFISVIDGVESSVHTPHKFGTHHTSAVSDTIDVLRDSAELHKGALASELRILAFEFVADAQWFFARLQPWLTEAVIVFDDGSESMSLASLLDEVRVAYVEARAEQVDAFIRAVQTRRSVTHGPDQAIYKAEMASTGISSADFADPVMPTKFDDAMMTSNKLDNDNTYGEVNDDIFS